MNNDLYLAHHGIKGQKWGVRRFEDASGHLTPEGKRRYLGNNTSSVGSYKPKDTYRKRKMKRIAAKVGAAALIGATGYGLYKTGHLGDAAELGKKVFVNKKLLNKNSDDKPVATVTRGPSNATQAIAKANKTASSKQARQALASRAKSVVSNAAKGAAKTVAIKAAKGTVKTGAKLVTAGAKKGANALITAAQDGTLKNGARKIKNAATSKAKQVAGNYVARKLQNGIDSEDPRTYIRAIGNAKKLVSDTKRYARAVNKVRKGDKIGAVSEMSEEVLGGVDKAKNAAHNVTTKVKRRVKKG